MFLNDKSIEIYAIALCLMEKHLTWENAGMVFFFKLK